ncbi:MAG: hypothetical protein M0D55_00340 [Elusimicrobiota bacterium]|nr:MAG: hypothetical protein M0D55_00340 [Elusimicrobiota bacterium]
MIGAVMLALLFPASVRAQVGCETIRLCQGEFMPKPKAQPDQVQVEVVQKQLEAARAADAVEDLRRTALDQIRSELSPGANPLENAEYLRALADLQAAVKANFDAHNKAIRATIEVYELTPPIMDFSADSRLALNSPARFWLPRYSIRERRDEVTGGPRRRTQRERDEEIVEYGAVVEAVTRDNGDIALFNEAFASPSELAIAIFHETSHWIDTVAKVGGYSNSDDPALRYRTEQLAYGHSARLARSMGIDATRYERLSERFGFQADVAQRENLKWPRVQFDHPDWIMKKRPASYSLAAGPADIERDSEDALKRGMEQAKESVDRSRQAQAVIGGAARPIVAEPVRVDPITTSPDRKPSRHSSNNLGIMRQIAVKACMAPAMAISEDLTWIQWADVSRMGDLGQWPEAPGDCERRVYLTLAEFARAWAPGMTISSAEVQAAAAGQIPHGLPGGGGVIPPNQTHDPVRRRVNPIIGR